MDLIIPKFLLDNSIPSIAKESRYTEDPADLRDINPKDEETAILRDIFSCLIGGFGIYIKQDKNGKYKLNCILRDSTNSYVQKLLPICENYVQITRFADSRYSCSYGRVNHVLCASLREYMLKYLQRISELESNPRVTLAYLCASLNKENEVLKIFSELIKNVYNLRGPPICTIIHKLLAQHRGTTHVKDALSFLFNRSVQPVLHFIEKWVFHGEIEDPFIEFFIKDEKISPEIIDMEKTYWDDCFSLIESNKPKFIPESILELIISTGKVQSVLLNIGKQPIGSSTHLSLTSIQYEGHLRSTFQDASKALLNEMINQYSLVEAFNTMWSVICFRRADLFLDFMRVSSVKMRRPHGKISSQEIDELLSLVYLKDMNRFFTGDISEYQISYVITSLHAVTRESTDNIKKTKTTNSKTNWDYLCLIPKIPWPINIVITKESQKHYTNLFRHILLWKRLDRMFAQLWQISERRSRTGPGTASHVLMSCRFAIHTFITSFINFLSTNVIHPAWSQFSKQLDEATTIEELISRHMELLGALTRGSFLINDCIFRQMSHIATCIWNFGKQMKKWNKSVMPNGTTEEQKKTLAMPVIVYFKKFRENAGELIDELQNRSRNQGNSIFADFALSLSGNSFYKGI